MVLWALGRRKFWPVWREILIVSTYRDNIMIFFFIICQCKTILHKVLFFFFPYVTLLAF
jgi:hypothetical protein